MGVERAVGLFKASLQKLSQKFALSALAKGPNAQSWSRVRRIRVLFK